MAMPFLKSLVETKIPPKGQEDCTNRGKRGFYTIRPV
jgi:hypothetical protein